MILQQCGQIKRQGSELSSASTEATPSKEKMYNLSDKLKNINDEDSQDYYGQALHRSGDDVFQEIQPQQAQQSSFVVSSQCIPQNTQQCVKKDGVNVDVLQYMEQQEYVEIDFSQLDLNKFSNIDKGFQIFFNLTVKYITLGIPLFCMLAFTIVQFIITNAFVYNTFINQNFYIYQYNADKERHVHEFHQDSLVLKRLSFYGIITQPIFFDFNCHIPFNQYQIDKIQKNKKTSFYNKNDFCYFYVFFFIASWKTQLEIQKNKYEDRLEMITTGFQEKAWLDIRNNNKETEYESSMISFYNFLKNTKFIPYMLIGVLVSLFMLQFIILIIYQRYQKKNDSKINNEQQQQQTEQESNQSNVIEQPIQKKIENKRYDQQQDEI